MCAPDQMRTLLAKNEEAHPTKPATILAMTQVLPQGER